MAERVFFHIGVPKSGTTFLQTVLWHHEDALRAEGVLLPARDHNDHRWGSLVVREDPRIGGRSARARTAWDRIVADVRAWPGTAVISHEFYGPASREQAQRAVEDLAGAEVHLVVTARDPLSLFTAAWQEALKYRATTPLDGFSTTISEDPRVIWNWRGLDPAEVLARWGPTVPADRVHVVPLPRGLGGPTFWQSFAGLFLDDPDRYDDTVGVRNPSMGLVESELLRRVTPRLDELPDTRQVVRWVRRYLGEGKLVPRDGERFSPGPQRIAECRHRGRAMVERITAAGYHVAGDVADLLVPDELPRRRTPADVGADELLDAALDLVADVVADVREAQGDAAEARRELAQLRSEAGTRPGARRALRSWAGRARGGGGSDRPT